MSYVRVKLLQVELNEDQLNKITVRDPYCMVTLKEPTTPNPVKGLSPVWTTVKLRFQDL